MQLCLRSLEPLERYESLIPPACRFLPGRKSFNSESESLTYLECRTGMEDCLTICAGTTDDELTSLLLPLLIVVLLWFWYNGDLTMVCRLDGAVDASDSVTLTTSELFLR